LQLPYLNAEPLDILIAEAGLSQGEFCEVAGITEVTLSRARHGRPIKPGTLRKLALGLSRIKPMKAFEGRGLVSPTPPTKKKKAAVLAGTAAKKENGDAVRTPVEG
jgi:transcriptional regulator with XRE-family HTH domain